MTEPTTPAPVRLRGFATLNIWADDVAEAAGWYARVLGFPAYFTRRAPDDRLVYAEFRIGDRQAELGVIDRRYAPPWESREPGGAVMHWHVDDLPGSLDRLLAHGATAHRPITEHGEGFVTASVIDPFGNVLGVMYNRHYLDMLTDTVPPATAGSPAG
ncbi:VOC family protein [Stackebrandtia albiflava]|nr:VOC family protein [Stackebrandtia albiflava]